MKFRICAAALALMMCAVSCGSSGESSGRNSQSAAAVMDDLPIEESISSHQVVLDGEYATVIPLDNKYDAYGSGLDSGLEYAVKSYRSKGLSSLKFSADRFEMLEDEIWDGEYYTYDGTYSVADGKIDFHYENFNYNGKVNVNIDDELPDYDESLVLSEDPFSEESLQGLSDEEKRQRVREENIKYEKKLSQDRMKLYNESGTYCNFVAPYMYRLFDKGVSYDVFPLFIQRGKSKEVVYKLYPFEDLICVPTYGIELISDFSSGEDFTVKFNMLDSCIDDPYSMWNIEDWEHMDIYSASGEETKTTADDYKRLIRLLIGNLEDTTIEFSNGKWTWTNSEGELVNNGYYLESSKHEGLIGMFIDEKSKRYSKFVDMAYLFYIDSTGKIWYPNWVKMN